MSLPVLIQHLAQTKLTAYCMQKLPAQLRDRVRLEIEVEGETVTLIESRPHFKHADIWTRLPVARFRFNLASGTWTLFSPNLAKPDAWRPYPAKPERDLGKLIKLLDDDDSGAFWG